MSISTHIVIARVDETLTIALDIEHGCAQYMPSIVRSHFDLSVAQLYSLMQLYRANLIDAVLDHFLIEAIDLALLRHRNFSEVFEHQRDDGLRGRGRDHRTAIADSLGEVGQSTAMIQMKMRDQHTVDHVSQVKVGVRGLCQAHLLTRNLMHLLS